MLGLAAVAEVVHAIEEHLQSACSPWSPAEARRALAALETVERMLATDLSQSETEALRAAALAAFTGADTPSLAVQPAVPAPAPAPPLLGARRGLVAVQASHLDEVCDGLDELRASIARLVSAGASVSNDEAADLLAQVERVSTSAFELRLGPLEPLLSSLARHAVELAADQGKRVDVSVDAAGTALERGVLDALGEPLLHLVRNAVDHGVAVGSSGRLSFSASARTSSVLVVVEDDGPGIDLPRLREAAVERGVLERQAAYGLSDEEALDLVFRAHVSTRSRVSEVSGRGLGLDVVRRVVESIGGRIAVEAGAPRGTRFVLDLPMRLTREATLIVEVGPVLVGLPSRHVAHVMSTVSAQFVAGGRAIRVEGQLVPLRDLAAAMGLEPAHEPPLALVIELGERRWALAVSRLVGEEEVLRRPADRPLAAFGWSGASGVLDDGRPVLLPSVADVIRRAGARGAAAPRPVAKPARQARRALVVDDSPIAREVIAELVSSAGLEVTQAEDGRAALELIEDRAVDLIVTDVEMPNVDGFELTRRVRARGVRTPIIVVTTRGSIEDRRRAAECGADAYVVKTAFRDADLLQTVRGLLSGAR